VSTAGEYGDSGASLRGNESYDALARNAAARAFRTVRPAREAHGAWFAQRRRAACHNPSVPKGPLFSTYRQGENRVTASLMAVFERIDLSKVERVLAAASGDSALQLFSFENQVHGLGSSSVPDARISASFALWFETKTAPGQVRADQLREHLRHLGDGGADERMFLLTPDAEEPAASVLLNDPRLHWISFRMLSQAIDDLLDDDRELVSEKEELLLRELQALFEVDNLLGDPRQVVVVPAANAYREYLDLAAYLCQPGRPFKHVERMAFYCRGRIEREIPLVRHVFDHVEMTQEHADALRAAEDPTERELGTLIQRVLDAGVRPAGGLEKVFLLTAPDDPATVRIDQPILNDAVDKSGRTTAWVMMQRYASLDGLRQARRTSDLADGS